MSFEIILSKINPTASFSRGDKYDADFCNKIEYPGIPTLPAFTEPGKLQAGLPAHAQRPKGGRQALKRACPDFSGGLVFFNE